MLLHKQEEIYVSREIHVNEKPRQSIVITPVEPELVERRSANKFRGD